MILDRVTIAALSHMLAPHMDEPAWPYLGDEAARARAKEYAQKQGLWDRLTATPSADEEKAKGRYRVGTVAVDEPIPVLSRSAYRDFSRTGNRRWGERERGAAIGRLRAVALALWLGHPAGDVDHLQDLIWSWCETTTWVMSAHESRRVDLGSSHIARQLSEILWMFDDRLEDEVKERAGKEIERRQLDPVYDWRHPEHWATVEMNWNHVCNANSIIVALYRIADPYVLSSYIHPLISRLEYAIHGFSEDGGCREGPGYWGYGFGHFLDAAVALHHRTGGELDITRAYADKLERISRYPVAAHLGGTDRTTFADSGGGGVAAGNAMKANRFFEVPELYGLVDVGDSGLPALRDWSDLVLYDGQPMGLRETAGDYVLPDLGQAVLRATDDASGATLAVLAGSNDVPHNHNDIGSFIFRRKGTMLLVDPGAPTYTRKTFSSRRYEIVFCNSRGHSVPLVNENEQPAGGAYRGTLSVDGVGGSGVKRATVDMSRAYEDETLTRLVRTFTLSTAGELEVCDEFEFSRGPAQLEEAFVTYEEAKAEGDAVVIGSGEISATLRAVDTPGAFRVDALVEESKEGRTGKVLKRIVFAPAKLAAKMRLRFSLT